jgi:hypothetical protein
MFTSCFPPMVHKIIATILTFSLVSSLTFAQEMPGNAVPVVLEPAEEMLILNSASDAPSDFAALSEITITPEVDEAVFAFTTDEAVHTVIEYGLTREYDRTLTTEPQKTHTETIGDLTACATYYYRVHVGDESREGAFETLCPVVKKPAPKPVVKKTVAKVAPVVAPAVVAESIPVVVEEELVLNAAPEEQKEAIVAVEAPQSPILPGPIAFGNDTIEAEKEDTTSSVPVGLLLFALLSGMVVILATFKKKKKWYQK